MPPIGPPKGRATRYHTAPHHAVVNISPSGQALEIRGTNLIGYRGFVPLLGDAIHVPRSALEAAELWFTRQSMGHNGCCTLLMANYNREAE